MAKQKGEGPVNMPMPELRTSSTLPNPVIPTGSARHITKVRFGKFKPEEKVTRLGEEN